MKKQFKDSLFGEAKTMNHAFRQFSMGAVAIAIMQVASAQVSMTNIVPMSLADQGTEIRVMFNGLPPQPQAYQLEQPSRLILDFDKAQQSLKQTSIPVSTSEASSIEVAADDQRSRVIVNLKDADAFTTRIEGNTFVLKINSVRPSATNTPTVARQPQQGVSNIGFQRGKDGEGLVVIDLLGGNTPVDVQQQGSKIVVRTMGNKIPAHLARRLNTNDFATPVASVDAYNDKGNGVITIQSAGSYEYMAYQAENKLTISLKRPEDKSPAKAKSQIYTGNKISLDFQDIEVRRVLQLLADFTGINMVAADTVQGNITLRLKDVPWDQALDIVLKTKNLDKRRNGNVIWIAPVSELIKAEEEEAKAIAQSVKLAPLQTEYIQLSYAKAADIEKLITQGKNSGSGNSSSGSNNNADPLGDSVGSLLSPRGTVSTDPRTNTLIINDTSQKIDQIRKMVDLLDVSVKQVMIEARIVSASTDFSKEMGVKWGVLSQGVTNNRNLLVGGSDTTLWNLREPEKDSELGGYKYTIERPDNLNVDLGAVTPGASRIAFGLISLSDFMLDLELSAVQADGYGEVISTPKVMTADKQAAKIESGKKIPYTSSTGGGANAVPKTEFIDATLSLDVTPSITPDGKVMMKLNITKDSQSTPTPTGQLTINKNQIDTNVLVDNGETVVLGGIFEQENISSQVKVPFLGDLPYVGRLFRRDLKTDNKRELLIFITPRIVNDTLTRNH